MFGIPGEVFWPTAAFGAIVTLVFCGLAVLRILPQSRSRDLEPADRATLEELRARLGQIDQLQQRVGELEERVDFTERLLTHQPESERLGLPRNDVQS